MQGDWEGGVASIVNCFHDKSNSTKEDTTVKKDNIISLEKPEENPDLLTGLLREGARELITQAVHVELCEFLTRYADITDNLGRRRVVRNCYLPQREIMTGLGPVGTQAPETREGKVFTSDQSCCRRISSERKVWKPYYLGFILEAVSSNNHTGHGFRLGLSAGKGWRKLRGFGRLADVINGVRFVDGIDEKTIER